MEYGPLFKKYMNLCGHTQFSNNRVSSLRRDELIIMAHNLFQKFPGRLNNYWNYSDEDLAKVIYETLKQIDLK